MCTYVVVVVKNLVTLLGHLRYLSQETLRNPQIVRVSNPQFFHGIVEDIRGIVKGCPRNRQRVSAKSSKGVRGIIKGCPQNRQRVSVDL